MSINELQTLSGDPLGDHLLSISMGAVPGVSHINKFGSNPTVATDSSEEIWDGSASYTFPATALMTKINTSADVIAMRGEVVEIQGLDANWSLVTQNASLDATNTTTLVTLDTPLIRVFRMKFLSSVVSTSSITLVNDGDTVIYGNIEPGNNQTGMAIYTVPAGYTAFVTNYWAHNNPISGNNPTSLDIKLWVRDNHNGYAPQYKHERGIAVAGGFVHEFKPYAKFGQKSDIYLEVTTVGGAASMSAGFDLLLVDNKYLA